MEQEIDIAGMLDFVPHPGFCVKDNQIIKVNAAAGAYLIQVGTKISDLISVGRDEYADYHDGFLYLCVTVAQQTFGASVYRNGDTDIFILDQEEVPAELQAMALAAQKLREPLNNVLSTSGILFPTLSENCEPRQQEQLNRINRGLSQLLRMVNNMTCADRYIREPRQNMTTQDIPALFGEFFDKAATLTEQAGVSLTFTNLNTPVYSLADPKRLEHAVYSILSNALKYTQKGGAIHAKLTKVGRKLHLTIMDNGSGMAAHLRSSLYSRYSRNPGIEDSRSGIGLGMVLLRSVASSHGGIVLVDQPGETGTRITMTMTIRQSSDPMVKSPDPFAAFDDGFDLALMELSESLPAHLYNSESFY